MIKKIDHIGIAVKKLEDHLEYYQEILGLGEPRIEVVEEQKVRTAMFPVGEVRIELLEATAEDSPVAKFIANRGEGVHHIAYHVDNIEKTLDHLRNRNVRLIDDVPRYGTEGQLIAFLHPKSTCGILTELCQNIE